MYAQDVFGRPELSMLRKEIGDARYILLMKRKNTKYRIDIKINC